MGEGNELFLGGGKWNLGKGMSSLQSRTFLPKGHLQSKTEHGQGGPGGPGKASLSASLAFTTCSLFIFCHLSVCSILVAPPP
jgi:hypothetical protein